MSSRGTRRITAAAVAALGLVLAVVPAQAGSKKKVVVEIGDYFFAPQKLKVSAGTTVVWHWPVAGGDSHDVYLKSGPKGVKKFQSEVLNADVTYRKKFVTPGTYRIVCTLHPDSMRQTITVK